MLLSPMTLIVVLALVVCFVFGVILIRKALNEPSPKNAANTCRRCHYLNAAHAKFCSKCGLKLKG